MINRTRGPRWQELEGQLRPFVARRLSDTADVDDVLQNIYLHIQAGVEDLRDSERFGPWLYRVARNALADHGKSRARHPSDVRPSRRTKSLWPHRRRTLPRSGDEAAEPGPRRTSPCSSRRCINAYREAVTLTEQNQGMSQKDAQPGCSGSRIRDQRKSRVQRGRQQIRGVNTGRAARSRSMRAGACCRTIAAWTARCPRAAVMS